MVKGYWQTFHSKTELSTWTGAGALKAESRYCANPAATGATRGCQLTICGTNYDNAGSRKLTALGKETILS